LTARDIACAWKAQRLGAVAHESIAHRMRKMSCYLKTSFIEMEPSLEMSLFKLNSGLNHSWPRRWFTLKGFALRFHNDQKSKANRIINFREHPVEFGEINTAKGDPEFVIEEPGKRHVFRCANDMQRQEWMEALDNHRRARIINAHFDSMPPIDKLPVFLSNIYSDDIPLEMQFVLARRGKDSKDDYRKHEDYGKNEFHCHIPQVMGKNKPRIFKFEWDATPKRLLCYRADKMQQGPYITLGRPDVLDISWTGANVFNVYIHRESRKNMKTFTMKDAKEAERFKMAFKQFRQENNGWLFYHYETLKTIADINEAEIIAINRNVSQVIKHSEGKSVFNVRKGAKISSVSYSNLGVTQGENKMGQNAIKPGATSSIAPPPGVQANLDQDTMGMEDYGMGDEGMENVDGLTDGLPLPPNQLPGPPENLPEPPQFLPPDPRGTIQPAPSGFPAPQAAPQSLPQQGFPPPQQPQAMPQPMAPPQPQAMPTLAPPQMPVPGGQQRFSTMGGSSGLPAPPGGQFATMQPGQFQQMRPPQQPQRASMMSPPGGAPPGGAPGQFRPPRALSVMGQGFGAPPSAQPSFGAPPGRAASMMAPPGSMAPPGRFGAPPPSM